MGLFAGGSGGPALAYSEDGGFTWIGIPTGVFGKSELSGRMNNVETFAVNPANADELVAVGRDGDVLATLMARSMPITWTVQNDTDDSLARHFGSEKPAALGVALISLRSTGPHSDLVVRAGAGATWRSEGGCARAPVAIYWVSRSPLAGEG